MDILGALKREPLVLPGIVEGGYDNDYHYNNNNKYNNDNDDDDDDEYDNVDDNNNNNDEVDPLELAIFHDLLYKPTEKSISLRVKTLVADGDANNAELLLETLSSLSTTSEEKERLRTYLPVLELYCQQGNILKAILLFRRMKKSEGVHLEAKNYVLLLSTIAEKGYFRHDSLPINGLVVVDDDDTSNDDDINSSQASSGPKLFDQLVTEMAEDVLELSHPLALRLFNAFVTGFQTKDHNNSSSSTTQLKPIHSFASMESSDKIASKNELLIGRVTIGKREEAKCPRTNVKLRLLTLNEGQRDTFRSSLLRMSNSRFEEFEKGNMNRDTTFSGYNNNANNNITNNNNNNNNNNNQRHERRNQRDDGFAAKNFPNSHNGSIYVPVNHIRL